MADSKAKQIGARLLAIALVVGGCATGASATPIDLSSGSAGFFSTPVAGVFTDTYTFTLTAATTVNAIVSSAISGNQDVDFSSLTLTGPSGPVSMTLTDADPFEIWTMTSGVLLPGTYTLTATGTNSAAIGSYAGNIVLSGSSAAPLSGAGGALDLSSGSTGFVNTPSAGAFTDIYTFSVVTAATLTGIVSSAVGGSQDVDFTSLILAGPSGPIAMTLNDFDPFESWVINTGVLSPGNYTLTAIGTNSAAVGTYVGNLGLSISDSTPPGSVPEPGTYALVLAGLGAALLTLRMRKPA